MAELLTMLALLLGWHAIADYPLQGDFLAKAKNRAHPIPGVPWAQALFAHAAIHAFGVLAITGSLALAAFELLAHALIDDAKCRGRITFNADQLLHVLCKLAYAVIVTVEVTNG